MAGKNDHKQQKRRRGSLRQCAKAIVSWALGKVIRAWMWLVDGFLWTCLWPWRHPGAFLRGAWSGVFRLATLISITYLVYDRLYETGATISSPASDPKNPFAYPFTITNQSHLFTISNVAWRCHALHMKAGYLAMDDNDMVISGSVSAIAPGGSLNIGCNFTGPRSFLGPSVPAVTEAVIEIQLSYYSNIFGYRWHRSPAPTRFTWFANASNPRWVKGEFAH